MMFWKNRKKEFYGGTDTYNSLNRQFIAAVKSGNIGKALHLQDRLNELETKLEIASKPYPQKKYNPVSEAQRIINEGLK